MAYAVYKQGVTLPELSSITQQVNMVFCQSAPINIIIPVLFGGF